MTNNPLDFEAERNRMAKELGLTYSDNDKAVFWQENMQVQEAKRELTEILANERKPNRTRPLKKPRTRLRNPHPNRAPQAAISIRPVPIRKPTTRVMPSTRRAARRSLRASRAQAFRWPRSIPSFP